MSYTALVLDQESHDKLVAVLKGVVDPSWKWFCHHMTINMGSPSNGPAMALVGQSFEITVKAIASNDKVIAVAVDSVVPSKNAVKHVTVAVNVENGGKPHMSNSLTNWENFKKPLVLRGTVVEVI